MIQLARFQSRRIIAAVLCMGISAIATAGYAYLVGPVLRSFFFQQASDFDQFANTAPHFLSDLAPRISGAKPHVIGLIIVGVAAVKGIFFFGQRLFSVGAGQMILCRLRREMYVGLLRLNPLAASTPSTGELVSRFTVDVENVELAITGGLLAVFRDTLQIIALAGLALMLDPVLGLVGLAAFPPVALIIIRIGRELRRRKSKVYQAFGSLSETVEETSNGLGVIQSFGAQGLMTDRFEKRSVGLMRRAVRALVLKAMSSPLNEILGAGALAVTLWYAHVRVDQGAVAPEVIISFFTALVLLYQPVKGLGQAQHTIQYGLAALDRIRSLTGSGELPEPIPELGGVGGSSGIPGLALRGIEVGYSGGEPVLKNLDLNIPPGSRVAVVGASGAGKTTLVNLLIGLLKPSNGELIVNGVPYPVDPGSARRIFAPVSQEPFLFDDDIIGNVRCGRSDASLDEVESACRAAGVCEFSDRFEKGLATRVGLGGRKLSMGQRQRVCLARALLSDAPVLLLDEVTASLDGATEKSLVEGLTEYLGDRSVLVVTHRKSTARWAQTVVLLEDGAVKVCGPSKDLLDSDAHLVRLFGTSTNQEESVD